MMPGIEINIEEYRRDYVNPYQQFGLNDLHYVLIEVKRNIMFTGGFNNLKKDETLRLAKSIIKDWFRNFESRNNISYKIEENNWELKVSITFHSEHPTLEIYDSIDFEPSFETILDHELMLSRLKIKRFIDKLVKEALSK